MAYFKNINKHANKMNYRNFGSNIIKVKLQYDF